VQLVDSTWVAGNLVNIERVSGVEGGLRTGIGDGSYCNPHTAPIDSNPKLAIVVIPQNFALNVRSGPGFNFPVVGQFNNGTRIEMTGQFYVGWAQLSDGHWVDSSRIQYSGPIMNVTQPPLDDVIGLQLRLRQAAFLPANFVLSGIYDQTTQNAVREFQRVKGLPVTGIADAATWKALPDSPNEVKELQRLLREAGFLPVDFVLSGIYDAATESAVREFQQVKGLPVTGTADTATWNALSRPIDFVQELQRLLRQAGFLPANFVLSGIYDQTTQNAVREFQRVNGIPVTGTINAATWNALLGATQPPSGTSQRRVVTDGNPASVYDGPGTEFGSITSVPNGSIVTITGRISGNWSELLEGGWIFSLWLEPL
jgi:peptidoglycan hydrolase-like protein with peptidoglycan-binding domain